MNSTEIRFVITLLKELDRFSNHTDKPSDRDVINILLELGGQMVLKHVNGLENPTRENPLPLNRIKHLTT